MNSHPHYTQQCTLEAWHIRLEKNNLNRDVGHPPITPSFIPLNPLSHAPHHLPHT